MPAEPTTTLRYREEYPYQPQAPSSSSLADDDPIISRLPKFLHWLPITILIFLATCDVGLLPLTWVFHESDWGAVWVYGCAGCILAQAALLGLALVFLPGTFWVRLMIVWLAAIFFASLWGLGLVITNHLGSFNDSDGLLFAGLALPLAGLAIQAPLWPLRVYFGWRLVDVDANVVADRPLSIRDYMVGTAIVAASVTAARLAQNTERISNEDYWAGWSIFFAIASGISLISVAPAVLLIFRFRDWKLGWALLVIYGTTGSGAVMWLIVMCIPMWDSSFVPRDLWTSIGIVIVLTLFAAMLGLGLKALRNLGYSLEMRRSASQSVRSLRERTT
jgi:hypothetical protein